MAKIAIKNMAKQYSSDRNVNRQKFASLQKEDRDDLL